MQKQFITFAIAVLISFTFIEINTEAIAQTDKHFTELLIMVIHFITTLMK